jgi:hypothetical protein
MDREVSFPERMFSGSEIDVWSFHPSSDGKQLGIYLAGDGGLNVRAVVPWSILPHFLESMTKACEDCEYRFANPVDLPERLE